ncbi:MAG: hypothetical protein ACPHGZ_07925, partial [Schleiferiaceae bacterium]
MAILTLNQIIVKQLLRQFQWWWLNIFVWIGVLACSDIFNWDLRALPTIVNLIFGTMWATSTDAKMGRSRTLQIIKGVGVGMIILTVTMLILGVVLGWFPDLHKKTLVATSELYMTNMWLFRVSIMEAQLFLLRMLVNMVRKPRQMALLKLNLVVSYRDQEQGLRRDSTKRKKRQSEMSRRTGMDSGVDESRVRTFTLQRSSTSRHLSVYDQFETDSLDPEDNLALLVSRGNKKFATWVRSTYKKWNTIFVGMYLVGFALHVVSWFGGPGYEIMAVLSPLLFLPCVISTILLFNRAVVGELMKQFNWWYLNISATVGGLAAGAIFKWDARAFSIIAICFQYFFTVSLVDAKIGRARTIKNQKILAFVCGLAYFAFLVLGVRLRWFPGLDIQSPIFIVEEYAFTVTAGGVFYVRFWLIFIFLSR